MIIQDHGLGIPRTENVVLLRIVGRRGSRTPEEKGKLFQQLVENLQRDCGVAPSDVVATIVDIESEDFTIGYGKQQFLKGDLPVQLPTAVFIAQILIGSDQDFENCLEGVSAPEPCCVDGCSYISLGLGGPHCAIAVGDFPLDHAGPQFSL